MGDGNRPRRPWRQMGGILPPQRGHDRGGGREADGGLSYMEGHTRPTQPPATDTACLTAARFTAAAGDIRQCGSGQDDGRWCPAPQLLPVLPENRDHHHHPAPIPRHNSDWDHECTRPGTVGRNGLHVPRPIQLRPPHGRRHTTSLARRRRHADYGCSGTIDGRHATEPPTRACVQTGGTTTPTTTPCGHRDPGTPGVICQERSRIQPHEYGGGGHPAQTTLEPTQSPTGSPQPQTPPGASAHGHQSAASQAAATQAHPEPCPRHGTPDRPTAGPAYAPPEDPPTQAHAATPSDTANTGLSDTVRPRTHDPTEGLDPQDPSTSSLAALGDLPSTTHAEPVSQRHHAPPAGPTVRPAEPSTPGRPAPSPDPGPDPARTTVPADAPQSAGPGSRPGPPCVSEGHARETAQGADNEAAPPAPPNQPQRGEPTVGGNAGTPIRDSNTNTNVGT